MALMMMTGMTFSIVGLVLAKVSGLKSEKDK